MDSKISNGVTVGVEVSYQAEYSNPANEEFIFAYKITIVNHNNFPVKLLRRQWHIVDSNGLIREVEGEGVVGLQPVIMPGKDFHYISNCNFKTEMGKMQGSYLLENCNNKALFNVLIPPFTLEAPFKSN